ncbi:MAG: UPF0175 family protein [Armatimonadota bacterium]|nr:UPF0175 family protein [Armatimonadota bacterium]
MQVTLELPDDIAQQLQSPSRDIPRRVLEAIALNGYRSEELTHAQVMRLLQFRNRLETDAFLKENGVFLDYTEVDQANDRKTHRLLRTP